MRAVRVFGVACVLSYAAVTVIVQAGAALRVVYVRETPLIESFGSGLGAFVNVLDLMFLGPAVEPTIRAADARGRASAAFLR